MVKNILITGGGGILGTAFIDQLLNLGHSVSTCEFNADKTNFLQNKFGNQNNFYVHQCDITKEKEVETFFKRTYDDLGSIDVVINNAGVTYNNHLIDYKDSDWDATYKVNLYAPYKIMQKVSKKMIQKKSGSIINVTSLGAELGFPNNPAYVAFKGALKQLTKAAACDLSPNGIRVNSVGPGYLKTNMTAASWNDKKLRLERTNKILLGRWGEPDDLIGIMIFLASDASSYITGQDFYVDGGWLAKGL